MLSQASQVGIFLACFVAASQVPHSHISSVWHPCKLTSRCRLLCQRRISSLACTCALSCGRTVREDCQGYNLLPLGDAKPLTVKSNGHILSRLPAKERALLLHCSQGGRARVLCKSLRISRQGEGSSGPQKKDVGTCAFQKIQENPGCMSLGDMLSEEQCFRGGCCKSTLHNQDHYQRLWDSEEPLPLRQL